MTRSIRLFGYGLVSIVLVLHLAELGFSPGRIGALLSLTLVGDTLISLGLSTAADRVGRRGVLLIGAVLLVAAGTVFCTTRTYFDAFAGGFVVQSVVVYWFHVRFGISAPVLGAVFFAANLLAGASALAAAPLARRIGLIETMVVTHIPSNVLLMLVPLMPTAPAAIAVLLLRFSISQMDVPTRQSYVMAVVAPDERSAAAGVTGVARTAGASVSPSLAALMIGVPGLMGLPFLVSGALKIVYDVLVWRGFRAVRPSG